jgi:hypothetical protein
VSEDDEENGGVDDATAHAHEADEEAARETAEREEEQVG